MISIVAQAGLGTAAPPQQQRRWTRRLRRLWSAVALAPAAPCSSAPRATCGGGNFRACSSCASYYPSSSSPCPCPSPRSAPSWARGRRCRAQIAGHPALGAGGDWRRCRRRRCCAQRVGPFSAKRPARVDLVGQAVCATQRPAAAPSVWRSAFSSYADQRRGVSLENATYTVLDVI